MISWGAIVVGAVAGYQQAQYSYLASLPPEKRREVQARWRREAEEQRLETSPEVILARECIENERLAGEGAERLLAFARELARRRKA